MITRVYSKPTLAIMDNESGEEIGIHPMSDDDFLVWLRQADETMSGEGSEDARLESMQEVDSNTADLMGIGLGPGQYVEINYEVKTSVEVS